MSNQIAYKSKSELLFCSLLIRVANFDLAMELAGLEPASKQGTDVLSTCLSYY